MKLISYNVNGIRAALKKGLIEYIKQEKPDVICFQETKAMQGQAVIDLPEYTEYWNSAERKGYAGTAIFTKTQPLKVINNLPADLLFKDGYGDANNEGRVIAAEYEKFWLVTVYTPNSKPDLSRVDFRHDVWDTAFLKYVKELEKSKPVIFCGDLNVAHEEIDLARPDDNHNSHGFTDKEREGFTNMVKSGFVDTFRLFNKEGGNYTWFAPLRNNKALNIGWRIDYFNVSESIKDKVKNAFIHVNVNASDHVPIGIEIDL